MTYDPSLRALVDKALDDWGSPEKNRAGLIPYPGGEESLLNTALYGIDIQNGELVGIIGMEKDRKTTFAVNIFYGICAQVKAAPRLAYLTLESGQPPERVRDLFISMAATENLLTWGLKEHCNISPEFLRYNTRNAQQQRAIELGMARVRSWPVHIYGPRKDQGETRKMTSIEALVEHEATQQCKLVCLDHAQQMHVPGSEGSMQQLYAVVDLFAGAIVKHGLAGILISQVSLTSMRSAKEGLDRLRAVGGKRLDEESNVIFLTRKDPALPNKLTIAMLASRRADPFAVEQEIDPSSGLFIGAPTKSYLRS